MNTYDGGLIDPTDPLAVIAALSGGVEGGLGRTIDELVRPILQVVADLAGLKSVYLTSIDWDQQEQTISLSLNEDPATVMVPEGVVIPWHQTLCERSMAGGSGWTVNVPEVWPERAAAMPFDVRTYVSVPVINSGDDQPYGTLCGVATENKEPDPRVVRMMELFARLIGTALERDQALIVARARADAAEERLAGRIRFAATVEHAMRTPLTVIKGWAETLVQNPEDTEVRAQGLDAILRTTDRLTGQVADLLVEARAAVGSGAPEMVDVRAEAKDLAGIAPDHRYSVKGRLRLFVDPIALSVLLEHLVENAVTHTAPGTRIRVLLSPGKLVVEDEGTGLPDRDDLFDAFVSADPKVQGTGLGLHIVASIAERLGAELTTDASDAGGARFTVRF